MLYTPFRVGSPSANPQQATLLPDGAQTPQPMKRSGSGERNQRTSPVARSSSAKAVVQSGGFMQAPKASWRPSGDQFGYPPGLLSNRGSPPSGSTVYRPGSSSPGAVRSNTMSSPASHAVA